MTWNERFDAITDAIEEYVEKDDWLDSEEFARAFLVYLEHKDALARIASMVEKDEHFKSAVGSYYL